MKNSNLTITDIAASAGVSKATVSRYINGKYEYMSEVTRKRIASVIRVTGYQPSNIARSLKSQRSRLIGLVVADIESPFTASAVKSIGNALQASSYNIIIANSDNNVEKERAHINDMLNHRVDGLIVNTTTMRNPTLISVANNGVPIVLLDRFIEDYKLDIAYFQTQEPIFFAVDHLKAEGYGPLALFLQPSNDISPRKHRREAFVNKLTQMDIPASEQYVFEMDPADHAGTNELVRLLVSRSSLNSPPAIITTSGVMLMHIAQAILTLGYKMPREIGLCGFDDWGWSNKLDWASIIDVGLTTLTPSMHQLGESTVQLLLSRLEDSDHPKREIAIEAPLVVRGSTRLKEAIEHQ